MQESKSFPSLNIISNIFLVFGFAVFGAIIGILVGVGITRVQESGTFIFWKLLDSQSKFTQIDAGAYSKIIAKSTEDKLYTWDCNIKNDCQWIETQNLQKIDYNADEISISAGAMERSLEKNGMGLIGLRSVCMDAGYFNEMIGKIRNKSSVVFQIVCKLVNEIIHSTQHRNYNFKIDRQGGRMRYAQPLMTMFGGMELKVLEENDNVSSYELSTSYKTLKLEFAVGADDIYLPTSLASMASKYLREQLMASLNGYFLEKCNLLKPTAGYWTDGKRFLNDLKTIAPQIQYDPRQLIRCR